MEDRLANLVRDFTSVPLMGRLYTPGAHNGHVVFLATETIDEECLDAIQNLRAGTEGLAIVVFYTANDLEQEIRALEAGADDCIRLNIDWRYAVGRLRATLARVTRGTMSVMSPMGTDGSEIVPIDVDPYTHEVMVGGQSVRLSPMQFRFLHELRRERGKLLPHEHLQRLLWGETGPCAHQSLKQLVRRLRKRLGQAADAIVCMPGIGYMLR